MKNVIELLKKNTIYDFSYRGEVNMDGEDYSHVKFGDENVDIDAAAIIKTLAIVDTKVLRSTKPVVLDLRGLKTITSHVIGALLFANRVYAEENLSFKICLTNECGTSLLELADASHNWDICYDIPETTSEKS